MKRLFIFFAIILVIAGCKGEDGEDGSVYVVLTWTNDVTAIDMSAIEADDYLFYSYGHKYRLQPGAQGYVFWTSNDVTYMYFIIVDKADEGEEGETYLLLPTGSSIHGDDGKDRTYEVLISGDTLYMLSNRLENRSGDVAMKPLPKIAGVNKEAAIQGRAAKE
jgi:hypothetical protein